MKITICYKVDRSEIPYCAYTTVDGVYTPRWSYKSFEDAKTKLLCDLDRKLPIPPESEEVDI